MINNKAQHNKTAQHNKVINEKRENPFFLSGTRRCLWQLLVYTSYEKN
jgi:hypothetical protein